MRGVQPLVVVTWSVLVANTLLLLINYQGHEACMYIMSSVKIRA